jgi:hypothetical protein
VSLLEKLKGGTRNTKLIVFPGTEAEAMLRILSNQEVQDSVFAAETLFDKADVAIRASTLDAYEDERTTQMLFRALRDPSDPKQPFAATVGELRSLLTKAEKDSLVRLYEECEREYSPDFTRMSDAEFEELWEQVKKNPSILSNVSGLGMLKGLLRYLASQPWISPTGSGSTS